MYSSVNMYLHVTVCLDLGKKISVPQDVMMEELNLHSNRGSRMFQERQKRVEKFTLEGKRADHVSQRRSAALCHYYTFTYYSKTKTYVFS